MILSPIYHSLPVMPIYSHHSHLNQTIQNLPGTDLPAALRPSTNHCGSLQMPSPYTRSPEAGSHPSIPQHVLSEHLKIIFNLTVHYPKLVLHFGQPTSPTIGQSSFTPSSDSNGSNDRPVSPSRRASLKTRLMNQISIKKITRRTRSEASNIKEQEPLDQISAYQDDHRPSHSKNSRSPHNQSRPTTGSRVPSVDQEVEGLDNVIDPHNHVDAGQCIDINIIPKSPSDTWLINGLPLYITGLYFKAIWGTNDYRDRIKQEIKSSPLHPRSTSQVIGRWHISRLKSGDPQELSLCDLG
ncbi:hypothetical protein PGT21_026680 [Puccinia graminis f. sp. tritici]|uniref:Uncharacterized protein n=1 Tax=Puccinia graminis f. sp. tritici TaxID=56615 RepID=A0A5B0N4Q2_PUCGR|nr:hypothetical protein PGT21_026680 [Puccinia graminis f. sp. tritici]